MSVLDTNERTAYLESPYFKKHEYGDFKAFYVTVSICTIIFTFIIVLNIVLSCCSRYSEYWNDKHTGNRWIISLWTSTPHKQPSLDYTEIDPAYLPQQVVVVPSRESTIVSETDFPHLSEELHYEPKSRETYEPQRPPQYLELRQKSKESDI